MFFLVCCSFFLESYRLSKRKLWNAHAYMKEKSTNKDNSLGSNANEIQQSKTSSWDCGSYSVGTETLTRKQKNDNNNKHLIYTRPIKLPTRLIVDYGHVLRFFFIGLYSIVVRRDGDSVWIALSKFNCATLIDRISHRQQCCVYTRCDIVKSHFHWFNVRRCVCEWTFNLICLMNFLRSSKYLI